MANDLSKLPPINADNFDLSSSIKYMNNIKEQMKIIQEASSLNVHAAIYNSAHDDGEKKKVKRQTIFFPERLSTSPSPNVNVRSPDVPAPGDALTATDSSIPDVASPIQEEQDNIGPESDDEDLIRLAELQRLRTTKSY